MQKQLNIALPDRAATLVLAAKIAPCLRKGDVLCLSGELGAGKTEFARALLHALGVTGEVPSPTFTLVQHYETPGLRVAHFDLYRLKSAEELDELGWDDALADGAVLVEWPQRAARRMPVNRLDIEFRLDTAGIRCCWVEGYGDWHSRLNAMAIKG